MLPSSAHQSPSVKNVLVPREYFAERQNCPPALKYHPSKVAVEFRSWLQQVPSARTATARRVVLQRSSQRAIRVVKRSKCMERQTMLPSSAHQSTIRLWYPLPETLIP